MVGMAKGTRSKARLLCSLTYYDPHISGLTIYVKRLLRGLSERGTGVTIVTSRFDHQLRAKEALAEGNIIRTRGLLKVSKGIFMPLYPFRILRELLRHDVLLLNLPQLEGCVAAVLAKVLRRRVITIVHCDIELPRGLVKTIFMPVIRASHLITGMCSDVIVVNSQDYADSSAYLRRFRSKVQITPPPCCLSEECIEPTLSGSPIIGFVGRFAKEKGIHHLVEALPTILEQAPNAHLILVGEWRNVIGERVYDELKPLLDQLHPHVTLTGSISDEELAGYFRAFDVLVLPSVNSTESFGMVQVESMLAGTPVIATDIPGVRDAVRATGMGEIVPARDSASIAAAVLRVAGNRSTYIRGHDSIEQAFGVRRCVDFFENMLSRLGKDNRVATRQTMLGKE